MKKIPTRLIILSILAVAGLILSFILTRQFYDIRSGANSFKSFCNISTTLNCDAVAASRYAEFIGGLPLSSFAGGWFLATLIVSLLAMTQGWRRQGNLGLLALFSFGSLFSVGYFIVMAGVIKTYCLYCLMIDGINLGGLGIALSMVRTDRSKKTSEGFDLKKSKIMAGIVVGSIFVTLVLSKAMDQLPIDKSITQQMIANVLTTTPVGVNTGSEFPSLGPANAPVTIVEFSDFQCPYCRIGASMMNSVMNRYPNQVRIVFRNFPLDPTCNTEVQHSMHPFACQLAKIALCAHRQGKFKEVYETFFENQASLKTEGPTSPLELAKAAHADASQLPSCTENPEITAAIKRDVEEGKALGISSTPTFFINGRKVQGLQPVEVWNKIIEQLTAVNH